MESLNPKARNEREIQDYADYKHLQFDGRIIPDGYINLNPMLLHSVTLKNGHIIPLKSLNLVIGPNNSGKSSFLSELQNLSVTDLLLDKHTPNGLTEEQLQVYLEELGDYTIPAPKGGSWKNDCWEDAVNKVRDSFNFISNTFLVKKWKASTTILDGKTRLSIVDDRPYQGISAEKAKNEFEILRRSKPLKAKLQTHIDVVLPGKFFALWNPDPRMLRAFICDVEPTGDIE